MAGVINPPPYNKSIEQCKGLFNRNYPPKFDYKKKENCKESSEKINDFINKKRDVPGSDMQGLRHRYTEQITGDLDPYKEETIDGWIKHDIQYETQRQGLRKELEKYCKNRCDDDDGHPIPDDALEWATKPPPTPEQYTGKVKNDDESSINWEHIGKNAGQLVEGIALVIGTIAIVLMKRTVDPLGTSGILAPIVIPGKEPDGA